MVFLPAHLQVVYYNCVKFHKNSISNLVGVALHHSIASGGYHSVRSLTVLVLYIIEIVLVLNIAEILLADYTNIQQHDVVSP
jgi:hypothetical protein